MGMVRRVRLLSGIAETFHPNASCVPKAQTVSDLVLVNGLAVNDVSLPCPPV